MTFYLIEFRLPTQIDRYKRLVYYPLATVSGWAEDPRDACHYANKQIAEQVISNLKTNGWDMRSARVIKDPLTEDQRMQAVTKHSRYDFYHSHRWDE